MLKLEKVSRSRDIHIKARIKSPFFSRTFCIAALYALLFHGFGLLIFHIAPFRVNYEDSLFTPVSVASDLGRISDEQALALLEDEMLIPSYLLLPSSAASSPWGGHLLDFATAKENDDFIDRTTSFYPFLARELFYAAHGHPELVSSINPLIKIHVSGPLAAYSYQSGSLDIPKALRLLEMKEHALTFDVRVDGKTGHIIWMQEKERKTEKSHPFVIRFAEALLKEIVFQDILVGAIAGGKVEVFIDLTKEVISD